MAANSVSHMIWFIVALIVASSTAIAFIGIIENLSESIEDIGEDSVGSLKTSIEIINDPAAIPYKSSTSEITFYVKNKGEYDIQISSILLVVNGTALNSSALNINIISNGPEFVHGSVAQLNGTVPGLKEGVDYYGWITVNGMNPGGYVSGSAKDEVHFKIRSI